MNFRLGESIGIRSDITKIIIKIKQSCIRTLAQYKYVTNLFTLIRLHIHVQQSGPEVIKNVFHAQIS